MLSLLKSVLLIAFNNYSYGRGNACMCNFTLLIGRILRAGRKENWISLQRTLDLRLNCKSYPPNVRKGQT